MLPTSKLVRRSILLTPLLDRDAVESCWRHESDAIALDLADSVPATDKKRARLRLMDDVITAATGGAEVFVQIERATAYADIKAAATYELSGVMVDLSSAAEVGEVSGILSECEREAGIPDGRLEMFLNIGTALGVWNIHDMLAATSRISSVALDEMSLCRNLSILGVEDFDALQFSRGRIIVETLATTRLPLGMTHPLSVLPREMDRDELLTLATRAFNTGLRGAICPYPSWVDACNEAFTPTPDQVTYYTEVRRLFAEGVARGTAAVPFPGGRMIDVPVDERAQLMLDLKQRCDQRDLEKRRAMDQSRLSI